jgi:tripartite-type tricarboxylate transporter receptor subunit TctC
MAASKWYQAGVDQGKAMVQGIVDVMAKYAPIIANQNLKPKALAGLLENIKTDTAFSGIMASNGMTAANETYSPGQISSTDLSKIGLQAAAGDTYVVNLSSLVPNAAAGEAIVNAIRSYNRAAGPANIQVA